MHAFLSFLFINMSGIVHKKKNPVNHWFFCFLDTILFEDYFHFLG